MNADDPLPLIEADLAATYTLEAAAELSGVAASVIVHYVELGFISAGGPAEPPDAYRFDDEALRLLRQIEHWRATCDMNEAGLKLTLDLLGEIERLRAALRDRR